MKDHYTANTSLRVTQLTVNGENGSKREAVQTAQYTQLTARITVYLSDDGKGLLKRPKLWALSTHSQTSTRCKPTDSFPPGLREKSCRGA